MRKAKIKNGQGLVDRINQPSATHRRMCVHFQGYPMSFSLSTLQKTGLFQKEMGNSLSMIKVNGGDLFMEYREIFPRGSS